MRLGFDDFTFRLKAQTRNLEQADTVRTEVAVQYQTRSWQTIEVDLGPAKPDGIDLVEPRVQGLAELGLAVTSPVRCLGLAEQVAQKLHACTSPHAAGRSRDVLDILIIDMLAGIDDAAAGAAARRVFEERATHAFPPAFRMPAEWRPALEAMARQIGCPWPAAHELETKLLAVIERLDRAGTLTRALSA